MVVARTGLLPVGVREEGAGALEQAAISRDRHKPTQWKRRQSRCRPVCIDPLSSQQRAALLSRGFPLGFRPATG